MILIIIIIKIHRNYYVEKISENRFCMIDHMNDTVEGEIIA